eukprot:5852446-Amphidinium_carterae.1
MVAISHPCLKREVAKSNIIYPLDARQLPTCNIMAIIGETSITCACTQAQCGGGCAVWKVVRVPVRKAVHDDGQDFNESHS